MRITDESSVPEMRIWSTLLIKSDSKWCILLSRILFLNSNIVWSLPILFFVKTIFWIYTWRCVCLNNITLYHMACSVMWSFLLFVKSIKILNFNYVLVWLNSVNIFGKVRLICLQTNKHYKHITSQEKGLVVISIWQRYLNHLCGIITHISKIEKVPRDIRRA